MGATGTNKIKRKAIEDELKANAEDGRQANAEDQRKATQAALKTSTQRDKKKDKKPAGEKRNNKVIAKASAAKDKRNADKEVRIQMGEDSSKDLSGMQESEEPQTSMCQ